MCAARLMFLRVYFSLHEFLFETIFSVLLFGMIYFYLPDIVTTSYFIGNVNMVGCVHFRPCLFLMLFFFLCSVVVHLSSIINFCMWPLRTFVCVFLYFQQFVFFWHNIPSNSKINSSSQSWIFLLCIIISLISLNNDRTPRTASVYEMQ